LEPFRLRKAGKCIKGGKGTLFSTILKGYFASGKMNVYLKWVIYVEEIKKKKKWSFLD